MKKKIVLRGLFGFPVGIAIGQLITILISLSLADGAYSACAPELVVSVGNEINAVILQTLLCGILGVGFGAGSLIWEMEDWSLVKQTGIYFVIVSLVMMPVAYFGYWMEHSLRGFLSYFGIFVIIFVSIWILQFIIGSYNVKKLNERIVQTKE